MTPDVSNSSKETGEPNSTGSEMKLLEPGEVIKPIVPEGVLKDLVWRLFGLHVIKHKELVSYDDKNFYITVNCEEWNNPYILDVCPDGYVLKILNSMDSTRPQLIEAQHAFMQHLRDNGIRAQEPALNLQGTDMILTKISADEGESTGKYGTYLVRLMAFIPGRVVGSVEYNIPTLRNIGLFVGLMHQALQSFHHPVYDTYDTVWSLTHTPNLGKFASAVKNDTDREVCEQVIEAFKQEVVPRYNQLQKGIIHGDANENNILVAPVDGRHLDVDVDDDVEYDVTGIIDFADSCKSYLVLDVAITATYMSIECKKVDQLDAAGYILAGYMSEGYLNETELDIMKTCICSRLAMSLIMGAYTYMQDPSNVYVLETAEKGWPLLHKYWAAPNDELLARWKSIIKQYENCKS
ncbi:hypothetical protein ScPMuIL_001694 [Solemya velum]